MDPRDDDKTTRASGLNPAPFANMQREMARWFDDMRRSFPVAGMSRPSLDLHESADELCAVVDLPGVATDDLEVRVDGNTLIVAARRHDEVERQREGYHMSERRQGFMQRSVRLPFYPDPALVQARYQQGVLTVRIPKRGQQLPGQRIPVKSADTDTPPTGPGQATAEDARSTEGSPS
jgi:HSP20 family protein